MPRTTTPRVRITAITPVLIAAALLLGTIPPGFAKGPADARPDPGLTDQRQAFERAEQALKKGDRQTYRRLKRQLRDYPLYPYLDYAEIRSDLDALPAERVAGFLAAYDDSPLAGRLRSAWLDQLAERGLWREYLLFHQPSDQSRRRCQYAHALLQTGNPARAFTLAETLWLHGRSQPSACDPVFRAWRAAGRQSHELVWQRIELAMDAGELRLAKYLERYLTNPDKVWLNRWLRLHRDPQRVRRSQDFQTAHPYRERMLAYAVRRMSRFDGFEALALWGELEERYPFSADERYDVDRRLALTLAREEAPQAYRFLQSVVPRAEDERLHTALLRAALQRHDWPQLLDWLGRLPTELADSERWRYWRARALEQTGGDDEAQSLYRLVARERSYYGFLAADRTNRPYALAHADTPVDPELVDRIGNRPAALRARELRALDRLTDARREWRALQRSLDRVGLKAAAKLAEGWGWQDQAIFTLAKSGYWDDLELRFPLQHGDEVLRHAEQNGLEPAWVYAVIRQESAFNREARSPAGARGLMQLMPATARMVATQLLDRRAPSRASLYDPAVNIDLGTTYLRHVLDRLGDHPVLATAAYNAGPHRVKGWLPERRVDADVWVELVPFKETRGYLRRVMYYTVIYESRLGREPGSLLARMQPIESATTYAARTTDGAPTG